MDPKRKLRLTQIPFFMDDIWTYDEELDINVMNLVAFRRGGKSRGASMCINKNVRELMSETEVFKLKGDVDSAYPRIAFIAPTKLQARDIIWDYLKDDLKEFPGYHPNNAHLSITIPRPWIGDDIKITLLASKYHDRIRGQKFRFVYNDEGQDAPEDAVSRSIKPALDDSNGHLYNFGTAKGHDHFYKFLLRFLALGAPVYKFPIDKSYVYEPAEIEKMRKEYALDVWQREYLCMFSAPITGAFYYDILTDLETQPWFYGATFNPSETLYLFVDIGVAEAFSSWVAQIPEEGEVIKLLDMYSGYTNLLDLRNDMENDGYEIDVIILPHDAAKRILSKARMTQNYDLFKEMFPKAYIPPPVKRSSNLMADIDVVGRHLHLCRFPSPHTPSDSHKGMKLLKEYARKKDKDTGLYTGQIDKSTGADHCADALRNGMVGLGVKNGRITRKYNFKNQPLIHDIHGYSNSNSVFKKRKSIFDKDHDGFYTRDKNRGDLPWSTEHELHGRIREVANEKKKIARSVLPSERQYG